jgi:hypothetical protein
MNRRVGQRLSLEHLEPRLALALDLSFDGAGRLIRIAEDSAGQSGDVTLLVNSAGKLNINDDGTDLGTFAVARNLSVSLGNVNPGLVDTLALDGNTLRTNLNVTLGDQDPDAPPTQFRILGGQEGVADTGTINGFVLARAGTGDQFFLFGEQGEAVPHVVNITGFLNVDMGAGGEAGGAPEPVGTVGTPPAPSSLNVRGDVFVRNSTIFVIAGSVGGNLFVQSPNKIGTIPFLSDPGQLVVLGNFGRPFTVGGSAFIDTGAGDDSISAENTTINGSLFVHSGAGDDFLELANIDPENDPTALNFINAPARVRGDVFLFLGAGNDQVDIGAEDGTTSVQFRVGRNLFVFGEQGNDTLNFINLRLDGNVIHVDTGTGDDAVVLTSIDGARAQLFALLGNGDDSFTVSDSSTLKLKRLEADGGNGHDTLESGNVATFSFTRKFRRFEV